jgi:hypothetical protein
MASALRHREPRRPRFGLRLRRKAFSCRLWDALQIAMGSEDRRSVDDRQVAFLSLIRVCEQKRRRPESVAQLEKSSRTLSRAHHGLVGACVCHLRSGREGRGRFSPRSKLRQKREYFPQFPVNGLPSSTLVLGKRGRACSPTKSLAGAIHPAPVPQDGSRDSIPPAPMCASAIFSGASGCLSNLAGRIVGWAGKGTCFAAGSRILRDMLEPHTLNS